MKNIKNLFEKYQCLQVFAEEEKLLRDVNILKRGFYLSLEPPKLYFCVHHQISKSLSHQEQTHIIKAIHDVAVPNVFVRIQSYHFLYVQQARVNDPSKHLVVQSQ